MGWPWGHVAHGMDGYHEKEGTPLQMRTMQFVGLCPKCYKEGPLMFDVHQFRDEITGRWENPERIRQQVCSPRYLKVVCSCDEREANE